MLRQRWHRLWIDRCKKRLCGIASTTTGFSEAGLVEEEAWAAEVEVRAVVDLPRKSYGMYLLVVLVDASTGAEARMLEERGWSALGLSRAVDCCRSGLVVEGKVEAVMGGRQSRGCRALSAWFF